MRVLMLPADQLRKANPYNYLLNDALRREGVEIRPSLDGLRVLKPVDIIHVHWPHHFACMPSFWISLTRSVLLVLLCTYHKMRGAKLIWTVHEPESLTIRYPRLERILMRWFTPQVNGLIVFYEASIALVLERYPDLAGRPTAVIPSGLFGNAFPDPMPQQEARALAGLPAEGLIISSLGDIRPYKRLEDLLTSFAAAGSPHSLVVAGKSSNPAHRERVESMIAAAKEAGAAIIYRDQRLSEGEMGTLVDASDVIALPYGKGFHSGIAILALERGRRVLGSEQPAFSHLLEELGEFWVQTGRPDTYAKIIADLRRTEPSAGDRQSIERFRSLRDWTRTARLTAAFYTRLATRDGLQAPTHEQRD